MSKKINYISLFSGAGIGCYAFKKLNFECIATNEYLEKRLKIQKYNKKCLYESGYILGDINKDEIKNKIFDEINKWKKIKKIKDVDFVVATPPCQGMSVVNQKKKNEMSRNSLVVKVIQLIDEIRPKIFIFENVKSFLKTNCIGKDGEIKTISSEIRKNLFKKYVYSHKIINFKNYGSNSSRTRTIVIGVRKDLINQITPFELFPKFSNEIKLKELIKNFKTLKNMNDFDSNNLLHHFKKYNEKMRIWIKDLKEGESAMDNKIPHKRPHQIINGKIKFNKSGFGDKYKRQYWSEVAKCIHTANGCLASQNTIHPEDDRVFSIAELMKMMSIPDDFKWSDLDFSKLNKDEKLNWILKNDGNIRQCIGEAVPTGVFLNIGKNIKRLLNDEEDFFKLSNEYENNNLSKNKNAAFYTKKINLAYIYNLLPDFKKEEINILEPSVGYGNFLIPLFKKYSSYKRINLTVIDIDEKVIETLKKSLKNIIPNNFFITFLNKDFLEYNFEEKFDLILGNPPFLKILNKNKEKKLENNIFELFVKKSLKISKKLIMILPKLLIFSSVYKDFRKFLEKQKILNITDFGELGFDKVKIETISIFINNSLKNNETIQIHSITKNLFLNQNKNYIFDKKLPYWIIYRDKKFDNVFNKMKKDIFKIYKNYEVANKYFESKNENSVWVLRSKNISFFEPKLVNIKNYDRYLSKEFIQKTNFYKNIFSIKKNLFLIPNLTYYPRVIKMQDNIFVNGSILVAELKDSNISFTNKDMNYFYSKEFREFYSVAFNYSTRTLNVNNDTIKFFGVLR